MKSLLIFVVILGGCGDKAPIVIDLATVPDMVRVDPDLSVATILPDMVVPLDMLSPPMPDLATIPKCLQPKPGLYTEYVTFGYRTVQTSQDNWNATSTTVFVQPDGTVVRPTTPITMASQWHCDLPMSLAPADCQLPCCAGDPSIVPMLYFSQNGWALFHGGQCQWRDPTQQVWLIDVQSIFSHFN